MNLPSMTKLDEAIEMLGLLSVHSNPKVLYERSRMVLRLLREIEAEQNKTCAWTEDKDGVWDTSCDDTHVFMDGGPRDNKYRWCPYCGSRLTERKYEGDDDKD